MKRVARFVVVGLFLAGCFIDSLGQSNRVPNDTSTNECFSKGGIGILGHDLYVDLKSPTNDLVIYHRTRWKGKSTREAEIVIVYEGEVLNLASLPKGFNMSKAVVVSFEREVVRFYDFNAASGGFYRRLPIHGDDHN